MGSPIVLLGGAAGTANRGSVDGEPLGESRDLVREEFGGSIAQALGEGRAGPIGSDGDRDSTASGDGRQREGAVDRLIGGVDPQPDRLRGGRYGGVDRCVAGGGHHQAHPIQITRLERSPVHHQSPVLGNQLRHVGSDRRGHDRHAGPGGEQTGRFAGANRSGAHHEYGDVAEVEHDGVSEAGGDAVHGRTPA